MIATTKGIILHSIKYAETSIIVRMFTKDLGLQSYLVPGVRKTKSRFSINLFQPMTLVNMVAYHKEKGGLQRIKEVGCLHPYRNIPYDIRKSSITLFLAEMLNHSIKNHEANPPLFTFIHDAMILLDQANGPIANFHLVFLLELSRYLGFHPRDNYDQHHPVFNLQEGLFQREAGDPRTCFDETSSKVFSQLAQTRVEHVDKLNIPKEQRKVLLSGIIDYYKLHLIGIGEVRSHLVLEMVME